MKFKRGECRHQIQLFPQTLDEIIDPENEVRLIDLFVNSLDLEKIGFKIPTASEGRPPYNPADLLKLYLYGYMNAIRSSRKLEKATQVNIEVMWLLKKLTPDHNTISNFRRDHPRAIKKVFRATVNIARNFELIGAKLIAGDSTRLRAQNSKKNNYNLKKIARHLQYIEQKLQQYNEQLDQADNVTRQQVEQEIKKHQHRKQQYQSIENQLKVSGEKQVSTSDPDSRHMIVRNNITEVAYTLQTTIDEKHKIPIDYKLTNQNDRKAMGMMLRRAKSILKTNQFTALYDKGYHTGSEFHIAHKLGIQTLVAVPGIGRASQAPDPSYNAENFVYNTEKDSYTCPQGALLTSNQTWYRTRNYQFKQYKTSACKTCKVRDQCTTAKNGKILQRSEYAAAIERNREQVNNNQKLYGKRQEIVEHPFGTIKRQWGFDHIITKKYVERASADVGFILTAYNLRRLFNLIEFKSLKRCLRVLFFVLFDIRIVQSYFNRLMGHSKIHPIYFQWNRTLA